MKFEFRLLAGALFMGLFLLPLRADDAPGSSLADARDDVLGDVLAIQGDVVLTQAEIDAAFSKIPAQRRLAFIRNGDRVNRMIGDLLRIKIVVADAIAAGYDEDPLVKSRMSMAAEKELAEAWMAKVKQDTPAADYATLAHEYYLANPDAFMTQEIVDVSHILVNSEDRSEEEALQLASSIREQLLAEPARFEELVMEFSDDPSKGANQGRFARTKRGQMVKAFEDKAFTMENAGDISEPVATAYGYHIIRLNAKFPARPVPFEEVKAQAMTRAREKHLEAYRSRYLKQLLSDPIELPDGAVEAMAKRYFGEDLELWPVFEE